MSLAGIASELLDDGGRDVLPERLLDPPALALLGQHLVSHAPHVPDGEGEQGREQQDPDAVAKLEVDEPGHSGRQPERYHGAPDGAHARKEQGPGQRQQDDRDRLDDAEVQRAAWRPRPSSRFAIAGRVALDARHDRVEGRGPDVHQAVRGEAHEDDVVLDGRGRGSGEDVHGRDVRERARRPVVGQQQDAALVRRDARRPELDLPVRGHADPGSREAQRQARGLEREARIETVAEPDDQLDPAQGAVGVRD